MEIHLEMSLIMLQSRCTTLFKGAPFSKPWFISYSHGDSSTGRYCKPSTATKEITSSNREDKIPHLTTKGECKRKMLNFSTLTWKTAIKNNVSSLSKFTDGCRTIQRHYTVRKCHPSLCLPMRKKAYLKLSFRFPKWLTLGSHNWDPHRYVW